MNTMRIFDYAMQMEKDGEKYYRELAEKCPHTGLTTIFNMLADEEVKHHDVLLQISKDRKAQMTEGTIREDVKNIFAEMTEDGAKFDFSVSEIGLYWKAQEIEQKSRNFYLEKAKSISSPQEKELFFKIADEERLHYLMLESIIEFVSRPEPGNWLENAEWYHTDEY